MADPAAPASSPPRTPDPDRRVIVRPMPKIVFFYLTWLASLACGLVQKAYGQSPEHLGTLWVAIFALNLLVISFDFTEMTSFAVAFLLLAVFFAGIAFHFLGSISSFFAELDVKMNDGFYFTVFGLFTIIYAVVWLKSRFEYWEFRHNEVLHRSGVFGEIKRYSTEDLRWFKQVPDVLERILLRSGRMVLTTPREPAPLVLEHVIGIGSKDEQIAVILGEKRVVVK